MRRYIFYFAVAFLAFGFGLFVVFNFYSNMPKSVSVNDKANSINIENNQMRSNFREDIRKQVVENKSKSYPEKLAFTCEDSNLSAVWKFLRNDKDLKVELTEINDCATIIQIEKLVDLNNDGVKDAIVGGKDYLVNGANNQTIWIVQKIGKDYKILLQESAKDYEIKKNTTNGFHDIFIEHHDSCCSSHETTYKFSKGKYRESKCLFVDYGTTGIKTVTTCAEEDARVEKESRQNKINSDNN